MTSTSGQQSCVYRAPIPRWLLSPWEFSITFTMETLPFQACSLPPSNQTPERILQTSSRPLLRYQIGSEPPWTGDQNNLGLHHESLCSRVPSQVCPGTPPSLGPNNQRQLSAQWVVSISHKSLAQCLFLNHSSKNLHFGK